jgi:integrase
MALWKRGKRYWTRFSLNGTDYQKPLRPAGSNRATTDWREAKDLEKVMISDAHAGKLEQRAGPTRLFTAIDAFLDGKRATARKARTVEFLIERLSPIKKHFGDVPLSTFTREKIEGYQQARRDAGKSNRTINMDIGALRQVLRRYRHWRRLEDDVVMLTESGGAPIGRVLTSEEQKRLFETAKINDEWEHVYCAAVLAGNTSMRGVEVKNLRRKDFDRERRQINICGSKNETSLRKIPLNEPAFSALVQMVARADKLGHIHPDHYLWCASQHLRYDPTTPTKAWTGAWRSLRTAAGLPGLRFHDLRHTVVTELLEAGEPDHVVESITGHLSRKMLEHYSHIRIAAKKGALDRLDERRKEKTT